MSDRALRVAYVGNFGPQWSTENDVRVAFEALGHHVTPLQENEVSLDAIRVAALGSDLLLWTGTWNPFPLEDVLDVFHACARAGVPTATYHLDTFWVTDRGGRKWWREPMFHTGQVFTADGDHQPEWERLGVRHTWLPPGLRHDHAHDGTPRPEFVCDVAFVGSNGHGYHEDVWTYRRELVDFLREMCARRGWTFRNPGGDGPKIDRGSMNDFYASAKVTVGDSLCPLKHRSRYWSDRAPEAPGRGGFLIMPRIDALFEAFNGAMPMYEWGNFGHLEEIVDHYLANDADRSRIRGDCAAIARAGHLYTHRMAELLEHVGLA